MDQDQIIQLLAQHLSIDEAGAKQFLSSISTSELAGLVSNLENGEIDEVQNLFDHYTSNFDFDAELETEGYDEAIEETDDLDNEYNVRKDYDDLKAKGYSHDAAEVEICSRYNLNTQELYQALKGPMTEYTNEYDAEINEALNKIELLKKGESQIGGNIFKKLDANQVAQVQVKSLPTISKCISRVKKMNAMDTMEAYAKIRGFDTIGLTEHELDIETMQDFIIENELIDMFEAMKNKWKKRTYWRSRPKNKGLGTVGHEAFDHETIMDPEDKIEVDDYGTIKIKELKDYIIMQGKK